mmetsp:Transcript_3366/g.12025  ORF Transcript_3366/g.12025 Transcript_3366/m.12025 type:complete len:214 (-) Transcript_3366:2378-3019(-)
MKSRTSCFGFDISASCARELVVLGATCAFTRDDAKKVASANRKHRIILLFLKNHEIIRLTFFSFRFSFRQTFLKLNGICIYSGCFSDRLASTTESTCFFVVSVTTSTTTTGTLFCIYNDTFFPIKRRRVFPRRFRGFRHFRFQNVGISGLAQGICDGIDERRASADFWLAPESSASARVAQVQLLFRSRDADVKQADFLVAFFGAFIRSSAWR